MSKLRFIVLRFILIMTVGLIGLTIGLYTTRNLSISYEATAKLLIDQPQTIGMTSGITNISKLQQLVPTYAEIVKSYSTAQEVSERLPGTNPVDVANALSATEIEKTQILVIEVRDKDAQGAMQIANEAGQVLIERIAKQQEDANVKPEDKLVITFIEPATYVQTNETNRGRTVIIALAAALILGAGAVLVVENARRR